MIITHLKKLDWLFLGAIALVFLMGLMTFYGSLSDRDLFYRQAVFGLISLGLIFFLSFFDWRIFKQSRWLVVVLYAIAVALLFVLFAVGAQIRGVTSWFRIGSFTFEPVELAKIILILVLAKYFSARHIELYRWKHIAVSGLYALVPAGLVLIQPDLGSAAVLAAIWFGLVLISGIKARQFVWLILLATVAGAGLWHYAIKDYQKNRVVSFLYPERDPLGGSYQSQQAIIAIGSGGIWGKGIGQGTQTRLGFLPEYQTDFIFAAVAEEWGLAGLVLLLGGWAIIFNRLYKVLLASADNFSRLFTAGFILTLAVHFLVNVGANLGFLPITGLPLAFVSYGGSNLISMSVGVGLVQAIRIRAGAGEFGLKEEYGD